MSRSATGIRQPEYLLILEGLPKNYTWQELRDLAKVKINHGLRTDTYEPGTGYIRAIRLKEVDSLYHYLDQSDVDGQKLRIYLWDTSEPLLKPKFLKCNVITKKEHYHGQQACLVTRGPVLAQTASPVPATPSSFPDYSTEHLIPYVPLAFQQFSLQSTAGNSYPASPYVDQQETVYMPYQPLCSAAIDTTNAAAQLQHTHYQQQFLQSQQYKQLQQIQRTHDIYHFQHQHRQQETPMYMTSLQGTPVNTNRGHADTEAHGIFVSGLNYKARPIEVEQFFAKAGKIVRCELHWDGSTGTSKGYATIQFSTAEEAKIAICSFHGKKFMKMKLNVRVDKDSTISPPSRTGSTAIQTPSTPLIVDGSRSCKDVVMD